MKTHNDSHSAALIRHPVAQLYRTAIDSGSALNVIDSAKPSARGQTAKLPQIGRGDMGNPSRSYVLPERIGHYGSQGGSGQGIQQAKRPVELRSTGHANLPQSNLKPAVILNHVQKLLGKMTVEVTNIPSRVGYVFTNNNRIAEASFKKATIMSGMRAHLKPAFWKQLAVLVESDGCGRCNGLSALAAKKLEQFADEHNLGLYIAGTPLYEHHVLIISQEPIPLQAKKKTLVDISKYPNAITVDLWQHNLNRQMGGADQPRALADLSSKHIYTANTSAGLEISCRYNDKPPT